MENNNQLATKCWDQPTMDMMRKLKRYTAQLQNTVPVDNLQRPLAIVNTQRLLSTGLIVELDRMMESIDPDLYLPISYLEGPPTIYGMPIWEKLEGESVAYYDLFKVYRTLIDSKGLRSIYKLHEATGAPMAQLELLRQTYHWQLRVSAFDQYRMQEREHMLEYYRDELQERHRATATDIFKKCTEYVLDNPQLLSPKSALEWAKMAIELERISVGLQPNSPGQIGTPGSVVNIQNNMNTGAVAHGTGATGDIGEDRQRLKQLVNVMNNIGLFEESVIVEAEEVEEC